MICPKTSRPRAAARACLCLTVCLASAGAGEFSYRLPLKIAPSPHRIADYPVTVPVDLSAAHKAVSEGSGAKPGWFKVQLRGRRADKPAEAQYLPAIGKLCGESVSFYLPADGTERDLWLYFEPEEADVSGLEDELGEASKKEMLTGIPMDSVRVNLTEGWNSQAGSNLSGSDGRVVFNIYRVTPPGGKEVSPVFYFEKIASGPVVSAFLMRAKSGYDEAFLWLIYRRGGYRILRLGGKDDTRLYWLATIAKARYFQFSHDRFPMTSQAGGYQRANGRFCLASVGDSASFLLCTDNRIHCLVRQRPSIYGAWREAFVRYRATPFDDMASEGDAIIDWMDNQPKRITLGKPEAIDAR